jgi:hypothetical protein
MRAQRVGRDAEIAAPHQRVHIALEEARAARLGASDGGPIPDGGDQLRTCRTTDLRTGDLRPIPAEHLFEESGHEPSGIPDGGGTRGLIVEREDGGRVLV